LWRETRKENAPYRFRHGAFRLERCVGQILEIPGHAGAQRPVVHVFDDVVPTGRDDVRILADANLEAGTTLEADLRVTGV
jgi:hypothetical protein